MNDVPQIISSGREFELYLRNLFVKLGYQSVALTPASGDFGADIVMKDPHSGKTIAVQAKFFNSNSPLGNTPIQEVVASLSHYGAQEGWVVTNNRFSEKARELARDNKIRLVEGDELKVLAIQANSRIASFRDAAQDNSSGASKDTSGLDVILTGPTTKANSGNTTPDHFATSQSPSHATSATPDAHRHAQHDNQRNRPLTSLNSDQVYNLKDLTIRWNCPESFVKRQIARGMKMYKRSNGRWEISLPDLLEWENKLGAENARRHTIRTAKSIASIIFLIVILVAAILAYDAFALSAGLPRPQDFLATVLSSFGQAS